VLKDYSALMKISTPTCFLQSRDYNCRKSKALCKKCWKDQGKDAGRGSLHSPTTGVQQQLLTGTVKVKKLSLDNIKAEKEAKE